MAVASRMPLKTWSTDQRGRNDGMRGSAPRDSDLHELPTEKGSQRATLDAVASSMSDNTLCRMDAGDRGPDRASNITLLRVTDSFKEFGDVAARRARDTARSAADKQPPRGRRSTFA
jgi:hypothetical protein